MSGISLAVAPRSDPDHAAERQPAAAMLGGSTGSLRVIELQLVAFIMVFSASGLVPLADLAFPAVATLYLLALSRLAFPPLTPPAARSKAGRPQEIVRGNRWYQMYVLLGTTVGLFLPLAHVLGGFARGDEAAVRSATPHLFLLSCQILTENVVGSMGLFSPPVRALVPLLYTVRRVFVIVDWVIEVWANKDIPPAATVQDTAWVWFGRSLALANLVYFSTNLFVFLIPKFLPRAFEKYFSMRDEAERAADSSVARPEEPAAPEQGGESKSVQHKKGD